MEGSSYPETVPSGLGRTSATSGPLLSDQPEKLHSQTDSILTAARLARRGWTQEGTKTGWQCSYFDFSAHQPSVSSSDGNQGPKHAEICLKDPGSKRVPVVNGRKTAEDRETDSSEAKQTEGASSAYKQAVGQKRLCSQAGFRVWAPRCRTTCRQPRRFKGPILPVIAEI